MVDALTAADLRCEHLVDPLGIDVPVPRLSWILEAGRRGVTQARYRVLVSSSPDRLDAEDGDLWDSGEVASSRSVGVPYEGLPLASRARCYWRVRVWDDRGEGSGWSETASWEMGLLQPSDWTGSWITLEPPAGGPEGERPAPHLRRDFEVPRRVTRARLYATALGVYRAFVNGVDVADASLRPGWTDYRQRVQYRTYDVTKLLRSGGNTVGILLGDGWYAGSLGLVGPRYYGEWPEARAQLEVFYEDGSTDVIATDETWRGAFGAIRSSDLLMGETYDARQALDGWAEPDGGSGWDRVSATEPEAGRLVAECSEPVRPTEELHPVERTEPLPGTYVFDLGQNMVGWVRLAVAGEAGTEVILRHGEMLNSDGTLYTENLRGAKATDRYALRGDPGGESFEPSFTFHGFRYVEVTGYPGVPELDAVTGVVAHSDVPRTGSFRCSHELLNRLQENILWGQRGNFLEVPTDCPQRDERLGWTGDAQVFVRTACFNMDVGPFFTKWLRDVRDAQSPEGAFPDVAPLVVPPVEALDFQHGDPAWGDAGVICPWTIYLCYGDERILEENFDAMCGWVEYVREANPDLLWTRRTGHPFGDWLNLDAETPVEVLATAFLAHSADLVARAAAVLGRVEDEVRYQELFDAIRGAFNGAYVEDDGRIRGDTQTVYALALRFGLLPFERAEGALRRLVDRLEDRDWHLSSGFHGVSHLLPALTDGGRLDVAYRLLQQETYPSWLYPVRQGATTIWERWDGWTEGSGFQSPSMNSFNHYAFGSVGEWLYTVVGGIDLDPKHPGYEHVIVRPRPGGDITWAEVRYRSIRGPIACSWDRSNGAFRMDVTVPPNTRATVHVPAGAGSTVVEDGRVLDEVEGIRSTERTGSETICEVGSGVYRFEVR